jgi:hypothetical protein
MRQLDLSLIPGRVKAPAPVYAGSDMPLRFYLGVHRPGWLAEAPCRLFVARQAFGAMARLPRARGPWALDSGGFTELNKHGRWTRTPREYCDDVRRLRDEVGQLEWAAPMDWMCEPVVTAKTGLSVEEHQRRTVDNFLELRSIAPDLPIAPVLQGWLSASYLDCAELYARAGVDLSKEPVVGVGSVCRRQSTDLLLRVTMRLDDLELRNLHGFGLKKTGLIALAGSSFRSADSLAWSFHERREKTGMQNDLPTALDWRREMLGQVARTGYRPIEE